MGIQSKAFAHDLSLFEVNRFAFYGCSREKRLIPLSGGQPGGAFVSYGFAPKE